MATSDVIDSVHRDIVVFMSSGSIAALLGMSSYLMSYEFQDFERVNLQGQDRMQENFTSRRKVSIAIMVVSALVYVTGIVLLTLGVSLYREEREEQAASIPGLITQIRTTAEQPSVNEPAILAGICAVLIVSGMIKSAINFNTHEQWGWIGSSLYTAGWIGLSFAAAMNNKSINSLVGNRLAWTLPGAACIVAGTFIVPWQLHYNYISGPGWPIAAIGYTAFAIGTSYLTSAPN